MDKLNKKYEQYISSKAWQIKRKEALNKAEDRCQVCNSDDKLEVHHRRYDNFGHEKEGDLIVLCHECHGLFHEEKIAKIHIEQHELENHSDESIVIRKYKEGTTPLCRYFEIELHLNKEREDVIGETCRFILSHIDMLRSKIRNKQKDYTELIDLFFDKENQSDLQKEDAIYIIESIWSNCRLKYKN